MCLYIDNGRGANINESDKKMKVIKQPQIRTWLIKAKGCQCNTPVTLLHMTLAYASV